MAQEEYLQLKLKTCLRSDNVQLGKAPHTTENNEAGQQAIKELAEKYAPNLNLNATEVESALEAVSSLTVKREKANETYKTEGVATLQIALPKEYKQGSQRHYLETTLDITSNQLIAMISEKFGVGTNMKLFLSGKTVGAGKTLQEQGVKHNSKIMVLSLKESEEDKQKMAVEEKQRQIINETITRTQKGFEILSERDGSMDPDTTPFLEITDQKGNPIKIPPAERKALILAMGLHEKGRTLLKKKDYETSLCLLLQADEQFSKCGPQLLNTVDNYAVLQLDIVWCYRALENLDYLENAKERLQKAESCFLKCYGEEQTRLLQIKEKAEMKRKERQKRRKHVDDINTLREMGCSKRDAARALHDAEGDLDHAFQILLDNNHLIETTSNDTESSDMDSSNREVLINQLGFDRDSAAAANVQPSTQLLVHHRGNLPPDVLPPPLRSSSSEEPSTSSNSAGSPINPGDEQMDLDLVNEVLRDIPNHEEDYLDLNLEEESEPGSSVLSSMPSRSLSAWELCSVLDALSFSLSLGAPLCPPGCCQTSLMPSFTLSLGAPLCP
ncbi:NEDD8 ultimate buster 1 [Acipenser ruthenus]|uniref:NEDD8 ultimate buster 1 n=1 Tax=Acipenser ruthenus TaxID=7906 RepID=A0A662YU94_ACIRT|nr:NEDD8 ultimate buster 1 [Acipenser ruthenus]